MIEANVRKKIETLVERARQLIDARLSMGFNRSQQPVSTNHSTEPGRRASTGGSRLTGQIRPSNIRMTMMIRIVPMSPTPP